MDEEYDQWVQSQLQSSQDAVRALQPEKEPRQQPTPANSANSDVWAQSPSSSSATASTALTNVPDTRSLDVSDFADLGAPSLGFQAASFYPSQFNTLSYGLPWPPQQPRSQLPLSNYSSLNGATASSAGQDSASHSQPMMIDPALTTTNGSAPNGISPYHFYNAPNPSAQTPQPQSLSPSSFTYPSSLNISSYIHNPQYYQQLHSHVQGTLSPHALHTPSPSMMSTLSSANSSSQTSSAQTPPPVPSKSPISPEERKTQFLNSLKPLLQPSSFTGAQAVATLSDKIEEFGTQDVDASTRLDILTKMRDKAGNHYFRAWSENALALDITRAWLKAGTTAKADSPLVETIMPLLHIIDRLPLTVESLKSSNLGKIIVKLKKEPPSPAIKDMASNIERRWRQMLPNPGTVPSKDPTEEKVKKRKLADGTSSKAAPPSKRVAMSSSSKPPVVKKEVISAAPPARAGAKSDSSFFSAPKPRPKLPSFKKAPMAPPAKKDATSQGNIAQPSAIDPFQEALKSMAKNRKESPTSSMTPPPTTASTGIPDTSTPTQVGTGLMKNGKKKKSVTWAPDVSLESVKLIERAVYDDDESGVHTLHNLRDLDRDEGAALHAHLFEEAIDWSEPMPIEMPAGLELPDRGTQSTERDTQELREQTALSAVYMSTAHVPDNPAEPNPGTVIPDDEVDKNIKTMITGPDVDSVFWSGPSPAMTPGGATVADLVDQLSNGVGADGDIAMGNLSMTGSKPPGLDTNVLAAMQSLPPEQIQHLLAQLAQPGSMFASLLTGGVGDGQQPPYKTDPSMANGHPPYADYSQYQPHQREDSSDQRNQWSDNYRGRGGGRGGPRGRGRGRGDDSFRSSKRKPCTFFQAGRKVFKTSIFF